MRLYTKRQTDFGRPRFLRDSTRRPRSTPSKAVLTSRRRAATYSFLAKTVYMEVVRSDRLSVLDLFLRKPYWENEVMFEPL